VEAPIPSEPRTATSAVITDGEAMANGGATEPNVYWPGQLVNW